MTPAPSRRVAWAVARVAAARDAKRAGRAAAAPRLLDRAVNQRELATGAAATMDAPERKYPANVTWSPDGPLLAVTDGTDIVVREAATLRERLGFGGHGPAVSAVAFSPDGSSLGTGGVRAFSPDGCTLAVTSERGGVRHVRLPEGRLLLVAPGVTGAGAGYVSTPSGYRDVVGAELDRAEERVLCRFEPLAFPFELCAERLPVPGLLARALTGDGSCRER